MSSEIALLREIALHLKSIDKLSENLPHIYSVIEGLDKRLENIEKSIDDLAEKLSN